MHDGERREMKTAAASDRDDETAGVTRPLGALSDALKAALDDEVARWHGAAQAYGATLRDAPTRAIQAALGGGNGSCGDGDDVASVDVAAPHSQSDASGEIAIEPSDVTLADQWAALENVLAALRPAAQRRVKNGKPARVVPLTGLSTRRLQSEIGRLRMESHTRLSRMEQVQDQAGQGIENHRKALSRVAFDAWATQTRARGAARSSHHAAHQQWRRWRHRSVLRAWRLVCTHHRAEREGDRLLTRTIRSKRLQTLVRQWWIASRWARGQRRLKRWGDARRLEQRMAAWKKLVEMARQIKELRYRARMRCRVAAIMGWHRFTVDCRVKRERDRRNRLWVLRKFFVGLTRGTSIMREDRRRVSIFQQRRTARIVRRVFDTWTVRTEAKHKTSTAIEWHRHCLMSKSFEAWNLLHRCFVYHRQIRTRTRAHYELHLVKNVLRTWRIAVVQQRRHRQVIEVSTILRAWLICTHGDTFFVYWNTQRLIVLNMLRFCFRNLQAAVRADHLRAQQLLQWKTRRTIAIWHSRAHQRKRLSNHRQAVQLLHHKRLLHCVAWPSWRVAFASSLQDKRLTRIARVHMLRKWWHRWKAFESYTCARQSMHKLLNDMWCKTKKRSTIRHWRHYCVRRLALAAKLEIVTNHRRLAVLKSGFAKWRLWIHDITRDCQNQAKAKRLYVRLILMRWRLRAKDERVKEETRTIQVLHRRPIWLQLSSLKTWKKHAGDRIHGRQARIFRVWRAYASRASQFREASVLSRLIRIRHLWLRWIKYTATRVHAREAALLVIARRRQAELARVFRDVWRSKMLQFSQARLNIQRVASISTKRICLIRWHLQKVTAKQTREALNWFRGVLRRKCFYRLHQYCVVRPRNLVNLRVQRVQLRVFRAWKALFEAKRVQRHVQNQLVRWRKVHALRKLRSHVKERRWIEERTHKAIALHRRCVFTSIFVRWQSFTTSMVTCRSATCSIRSRRLQCIFSSWRHAFARQIFVHGIEAQYDQVLLRRSWSQFVLAIQLKQDARDVWLAKLRTIVQRKVLCRWKQLVEIRRVALLKADWLYITAQCRLRQVAFDEWVHFTTIRAFVHLRQRLEARAVKANALRCWKLFAITECRRRVRSQRAASRAFLMWKKFALNREAAREIARRSQYASIASAWKTWRVEFWIRQYHATSRTDILRTVLSAWRSLAVRRGQSPEITGEPRRYVTAFDEALMLQHVARQQRDLVRRVIHAWALAAQTLKRQRRNTARTPSTRALSMKEEFRYKPPGLFHDEVVKDENAESDRCASELWDQENADPNRKREEYCGSSVPIEAWSRQDAELAALEFWSSRVVAMTFRAWRAVVVERP